MFQNCTDRGVAKPAVLPKSDFLTVAHSPFLSNFDSMHRPHYSFPEVRGGIAINTEYIRTRGVILLIDNCFPEFLVILDEPSHPGTQKTLGHCT